jgi:predicted transcriptional regulator of viral defense system
LQTPNVRDRDARTQGQQMSTPSPRGTIARWVDGLSAQGRSTFTAAEVRSQVGGTDAARKLALNRLVRRQLLFQPHHGFFVVVPPEYRQVGAPPPLWYIDALMRLLGLPYYVGLLSAADIHGDAHQAPQEFHVCTSRPIRRMTRGPYHISWFVKKAVAITPITEKRTPNGYARVSSPAATALDLVHYARHAGQLSSVASALQRLVDVTTPHDMNDALRAGPVPATVQRLGYLLSRASGSPVIHCLEAWLSHTPHRTERLCTGVRATASTIDMQWRLALNHEWDANQCVVETSIVDVCSAAVR